MKLQIEVPDEVWGVSVTVVANNKDGGSNMLTTTFEPVEKVTIRWKDREHKYLVDIKE